jgi:2'-5' RNA ligase
MTKENLSPAIETTARHRVQTLYDQMWEAAIGKVRANQTELDPILAAGKIDHRRGMTLIARPSAVVRKKVAALLRGLRRLEPNQYYSSPLDFHLTVLSLFAVTADFRPFFARSKDYIAAVDAALRSVRPIPIEFSGITVSPAAILIQGFPETEALNDLRDQLRHELRRRDLTAGLDVRYRLVTAHLTVGRFKSRLHDSGKLAEVLAGLREKSFGATSIRNLALVKNDWYMSHRTLQTVKRYRLAVASLLPQASRP